MLWYLVAKAFLMVLFYLLADAPAGIQLAWSCRSPLNLLPFQTLRKRRLGASLWGGVDGLALILLDKRGGSVDLGFGSVPVHLEGLEPSLLTNCAQ